MPLQIFINDGKDKIDISVKECQLTLLLPILLENWVPFCNCGICGRNADCKYTVKTTSCDFDKVKCGVVKNFISEICLLVDNRFTRLQENEQQNFLDAFYYLTQFCLSSESFIGIFQSQQFIQKTFDGTIGIEILGQVSAIREHLNKACEFLKGIPMVSSGMTMLLVEGQSEKTFVERLKIHNDPYLSKIVVESYDGEANKRKDKVALWINYFKDKGYKVILQIDRDGKDGLNEENSFGLGKHISSGLLTEDDIFAFEYDLESAYPRQLLIESLKTEYQKNEQTILKALDKPENEKTTLYKRLQETLDWTPTKSMIAVSMADYLSYCNVFHHPDFIENEIVKFFKFISKHSLNCQ